MVKPQEKPVFMNGTPSPIREHEQEGIDVEDEYAEASSASGCGCFRLFCFQSYQQVNNGEGNTLLQENNKETWLVRKLKWVKEGSEVIAGPKWKNFIRRISKYFNKKKKKRRNQFQYDPDSYALNFDDGYDEEDNGFGYSSRAEVKFSGDTKRDGL